MVPLPIIFDVESSYPADDMTVAAYRRSRGPLLAWIERLIERLLRHEQKIRNCERLRERRRVLATLTVEETVEDPDFPGCFW